MEVATCVRIVDFRDWDESYLFSMLFDEMQQLLVLRGDEVLDCLYVKENFTWKLMSGDRALRVNGMHWNNDNQYG